MSTENINSIGLITLKNIKGMRELLISLGAREISCKTIPWSDNDIVPMTAPKGEIFCMRPKYD